VPDCAAVTEAQLKMLLTRLTTCTPEDPIDGRSVETCTLKGSMAQINVPVALKNFGGTLDLVGYSVSSEARAGGSVAVGLRWIPAAPQSRLKATFTLEDAVGTVWKKSEVDVIDTRYWFPTTWKVGSYVEQKAELTLPLRLPPGVYTAVLRLTDENGHKVGVWWASDGDFNGTHLSLGEVTVLPGERSANDLGLDFEVSAEAPGLHLVGVTPPEGPLWGGERMPFQLGWERTAGQPSETLEWTLTCAGEVQDSGILALAPGSPSQWPIGFRYRLYYAPRPDPSVSEGECELWVTPEHGTALLVGTVEIRQRARTFELPHNPQYPMRKANSLGTLIGADISEGAGDTLTVTLYWKAEALSEEAYTVFVHLIGPDGALVAQSDHEPQNGEAPTTSWVPGQIIIDTHTLALPTEMAPGRYNLFVGLYGADSGVRIQFFDRRQNDRAFIGEVEIP
jgi:hypothetical protein